MRSYTMRPYDADKNSMVSLDAVAEVVNQELDGSLHQSAREQFE